MPMDRSRYGANWNKVSRVIRRIADNRCEFCGVANGSPLPSGRAGRVVLTVAHLGASYTNKPGSKHDKHDVRRENLRALCQSCHLALDLEDHIAHARETRQRRIREAAMQAGQLTLFAEDGDDGKDFCSTCGTLVCPDCSNCEQCYPGACYVLHWS